MSFENRMRCLRDLKDIGFQTGCGFMVGSPFQTPETLAEDLKFIEKPFALRCAASARSSPEGHTVWRQTRRNGGADGLPALVAAAHAAEVAAPGYDRPRNHPPGRTRTWDLHAGANVVMPNLSPLSVRKNMHCTTASCAPARRRRSASAACRGVCSRSARIRHRPRRRKNFKICSEQERKETKNGCL